MQGPPDADSIYMLSVKRCIVPHDGPPECDTSEKSGENQAGAAAAGRPPAGEPLGAVQRLRDPRLPVQEVTPAEARPVLPGQLYEERTKRYAVRPPPPSRRGQTTTPQLRADARAGRPVDRGRHGAVEPATSRRRNLTGGGTVKRRTWHCPVESSSRNSKSGKGQSVNLGFEIGSRTLRAGRGAPWPRSARLGGRTGNMDPGLNERQTPVRRANVPPGARASARPLRYKSGYRGL